MKVISLSTLRTAMSTIQPKAKRITTLAVMFVLATAIIAFASIPGPGGAISTCYLIGSGALRVVDTGTPCKNNETALTIDGTGPQGPQGPQGPAGPTGPTGPQGATGASGSPDVYYGRFAGPTGIFMGYLALVTVAVPAGTYAVNAKIVAVGQSSQPHSVDCKLSSGDQAHATFPSNTNLVTGDGTGTYATMALQDVTTINAGGGTIVLSCESLTDALDYFQDGALTAIRVTPGP